MIRGGIFSVYKELLMGHWSRRDILKTGLAVPAATGISRRPILPFVQTEESHVGGSPGGREHLLFDSGWRFHFGHAGDAAKDFGFGAGRSGGFQKTGNFLGPSNLAFDDSDWKPVDLPHDWVIELPFKNDPSLSSKGFYPIGRSYPETSVGWYRRVFELPASDSGRRLSVEFDAVYRDATVVLNGFYIGRHSGGYDPFSFDVTDFAIPGDLNVLLVRADATLSDGWFYEGAGIYRHVRLVKTAPVHVKKWGTFARAQLRPGVANVSIRTEVENHLDAAQNVRVVSTILGPAGQTVMKTTSTPQSIARWAERAYEQEIELEQPALWSLENRNLYTLVTEIEASGVLTDQYQTRFGIRSLHFDPDSGFFLNGKPVKVKGTCNHQDHAGVGSAVPDALQYFRVRKLQEMGCNAYRTSHNPPASGLLDACDELGMLVLDETRMMSSNPEGLAQFANLVRRDRNHPSVFMWSMGNEERESTTEFGLRILTAMKRVAAREDGSRPFTIAPPPLGMGLGKGGLTVSDVMGYNYADPQAEAYHKSNPKVPMIGTENVSAVATRGIYLMDRPKGFVGSYDTFTTTGRASAEGWWRFVNARPWVAGGFVWTGFDYRGEPSPYQWPNISSQYGVMDTCGFPKDSFFYYQSWWTTKPVLHIYPHWNWSGLEGQEIAVWVYSNLDRVELLHNGKSLGAKDVPRDSHVAWNVKYVPGAIEAVGYKGGRQVLNAKRETAGPSAALVIRADRQQIAADGADVAVFAVEVQDSQGHVSPLADNEVTFHTAGEGRVIGVGNGDPTCQDSDIGSSRKAFCGYCMALVRSTTSPGSIRIEVTSPSLTPSSITIESHAIQQPAQVPEWERTVPQGPGITGLWRPIAAVSGPSLEALQMSGTGGDMVFTLLQTGDAITGAVEAAAAGFGGSGSGGPIEDGHRDGANISFRAGTTTYTGTVSGEHIELRRSAPSPFAGMNAGGRQASPNRVGGPAIGPLPDGSDPSLGGGGGPGRAGQNNQAIVLRRAAR